MPPTPGISTYRPPLSLPHALTIRGRTPLCRGCRRMIDPLPIPAALHRRLQAGELVRYDKACRAIAEAKAVDEVKGIRDTAEALRAAARVAGNRQAEIDMAEIRIRAERRVGELLAAQRDAGLLSQGAQGTGSNQHEVRGAAEHDT